MIILYYLKVYVHTKYENLKNSQSASLPILLVNPLSDPVIWFRVAAPFAFGIDLSSKDQMLHTMGVQVRKLVMAFWCIFFSIIIINLLYEVLK